MAGSSHSRATVMSGIDHFGMLVDDVEPVLSA
jgi:hypothetical protein